MKIKFRILMWLAVALVAAQKTEIFADEANVSSAGFSIPTLTLDGVVGEVVSNNPAVKAARAKWEAMKEVVPQAVAWEDARGEVDSVLGRFVDVPNNSFSDQKFAVEQTLPVSGRNRM